MTAELSPQPRIHPTSKNEASNILRDSLISLNSKVSDIISEAKQMRDKIRVARYCYCYKRNEYPDKIKMYQDDYRLNKCELCHREVCTNYADKPEPPPKICSYVDGEILDPNPHLNFNFAKPTIPIYTTAEELESKGWNGKLETPDEAGHYKNVNKILYYDIWKDEERRRFQDITEGYREFFEETRLFI